VSGFAQQLLTAREWSEILAEPMLDRRYLSTPLGPDIADYLRALLNERGGSPETADAYERILARIAVTFPHKTAGDLEKDDLRQIRDTYPPASRRKVMGAIRSFFKWLYREERIDRNVADLIPYPKKQPRKVRHLFSDAEQARLISNGPEAIRGKAIEYRDRLCITILLDAGIRRAELLALCVEDIDPVQNWLIVRHGKGDRSRVVPIAADGRLVKAFRFFMQTPLPRLERTPEPTDHLLYPFGVGPYGITWVKPERELSHSAYWYWWRGCLKRARVSYRSGHTARHTLGNEVTRRSGAERAQKIMGHTSIRTTVDEYGWLQVDDAREAIEKMERDRESA
jgi:site-specific recombinase XerD